MRRFLEAVRRLLGAILPAPPDDAVGPTYEESDRRRRRLRLQRFEKGGRGGDR